MRWSSWILLAIVFAADTAFAQDAISRVGFVDRFEEATRLRAALTAAGPKENPPAVNIHLRAVVDTGNIAAVASQLEAKIGAYAGDARFRIVVELVRARNLADEEWSRSLSQLSERFSGRVAAYLMRLDDQPLAAEQAAFSIKNTAISLRALDQKALFGIGPIGADRLEWLAELYRLDLAPYVDVVGIGADDAGGLSSLIKEKDEDALIIALDRELPDAAGAARRRFVETQMPLVDTRVTAVSYVAGIDAATAVAPALGMLSVVLSQVTAPLDEPIKRALGPDRRDARARLRIHGTFGLGTGTQFLIYTLQGDAVTVELSERSGSRPSIIDAVSGRRSAVESFAHDATTMTARFTLPPTEVPLVIDWSDGSGELIVERESVGAARLPSAIEIIARHQQAQAVQRRALQRFVANLWTKQSFRTGPADPGFDVVTENRFFTEGEQSEWEEQSFSLNGTKWGKDRPPFPLLQPEKVLSLPLQLRLSADYRYRLGGVETIRGRAAYRLDFDPIDPEKSLYRGTVWIDRETFTLVQLHTIQTKLAAPVTSSEETQEYAPVGAVDGKPVVLLTRTTTHQSIFIAGRTLALERELQFSGFQLNPADFTALREAARGGDNIMYRDTDQGLRYLTKEGGTRVVSDMSTSTAKAFAIGVTYDPSFDYPIPLGGLNYLDFDFLGKDNQLALIYGGVLALVNIQRPRLLTDRLDASVDMFAIGIKGNDRTYDAAGERPGERVQTLPFSTGVNIGWKVTQFHRAVFMYQFRFDGTSRDELTSPDFVVPSSTITNGVGGLWDWKRSGYAASVAAVRYQRANWRTWGYADHPEQGSASYVKYSASVTKDLSFGLHKFHFNGAYFGGERLDRFSAYQFGFFDENRIHGVPASGLRFTELGMFRGSYSFNLFEQYRLDLFFDQAYGRENEAAREWEPVTGLGVSFNVRGPRGTMLRGDIGKGLLPERFRNPGSFVFQLQILKPLK